VRIPIRERYEIGAVPSDLSWGQLPFLAVASEQDGLYLQHEGPWGDAGARLCGTLNNWTSSTAYLWTWESPRPDV
jgi:hypothetical protein